MTAGAFALVLTAAVAHAVWNLAAKRVVADRVVVVTVFIVGSVLLWVPLGIGWAITTGQRPGLTWLGAAAVSAVIHVVYNLVLVHGVCRRRPQPGLPARARGGRFVVLLVAVSLLGEAPSISALAGAGCVVLGVLVMTLEPSGPAGPPPRGCDLGHPDGLDDRGLHVVGPPRRVGARRITLSYFCLGLVLQAVPLSLATLGPRAGDARCVPS